MGVKIIIIFIVLSQLLFSCGKKTDQKKWLTSKTESSNNAKRSFDSTTVYQSDNLMIRKVSDQIYEHTSFLNSSDSGRLSCNGIIILNKDEAVIFDTPTNDQTAVELLEYLRYEMNLVITAIVATDWHDECLGGLGVFHRYGVRSHASKQTIKLAKLYGSVVPQQGFEEELVLNIGKKKVLLEYVADGRGGGNTIGYSPDDKLIFGGCLIKSFGSKKENLTLVTKKAWIETICRIKTKYPDVKKVVPGRGESGGLELLDYTINLCI